jgi:thiol-disulfide isomerase/thioredoxin
MKKKSILLLAVLAIAFTLAHAQQTRPVIIAGKIINQTAQSPQAIKFNFCNPLINGSLSTKINSNGEFNVRQDMLYTQNMTVFYTKSFINLYVQPGDSVFLTIDASQLNKGNYGWLTISGSHARISTQLNLCADYLYRLPMTTNNLAQLPNDMLAAIKSDYNHYMTALDEYNTKHKLDDVVIAWAKRDLKFLLSNSIYEYMLLREGSATEKLARRQMFANAFFDMYNADNFQSMMFPYHLESYAGAITSADSSIAILYKQNRVTAVLKKVVTRLLKEPAGECRDYMIFKQIEGFALQNPQILDSVKEAGGWFTKAEYYRQFKIRAGEIKKPFFAQMAIDGISYLGANGSTEPVLKTDALNYLTKKYPGKVLYIDVYATWCGPCIEEIKQTQPVHDAMKGKDVVFVNLCLQSDIEKWKPFIKDNKMDGEHYFFNGDATKLFMGNYKLGGYPSYILVNKKGEIVTTEAPRPSDTDHVKSKLAGLLAE